MVVNTSCVDGSIVFIDPISFSVLKKIQFQYQDYEIPKDIKAAINHLKDVLNNVQEKSGKDSSTIFAQVVDPITQTIPIRQFVNCIMDHVDKCIDQETLFKACRVLDRENKGAIGLDDFLSFTEQVAQEQEDMNQALADMEL